MKYDFTDSQNAIMELAISKFGEKNQIKKAIEEFCELYLSLKDKAFLFFENQHPEEKQKISEEVADCIIMYNQLCMILERGLDCSLVFIMYDFAMPYIERYYNAHKQHVCCEISFKLLRLENMLKNI